jgi:hypothetical protein
MDQTEDNLNQSQDYQRLPVGGEDLCRGQPGCPKALRLLPGYVGAQKTSSGRY